MNEPTPPQDNAPGSRQFDLRTLLAAMSFISIVFGSLYWIHATTWSSEPRFHVSPDFWVLFVLASLGFPGFFICWVWILVRLSTYRPRCWSLVWFSLLAGMPLCWMAFGIRPTNSWAWIGLLWFSGCVGLAEVEIRRLRHHFLTGCVALLASFCMSACKFISLTDFPER
jgi:hypothetical protein